MCTYIYIYVFTPRCVYQWAHLWKVTCTKRATSLQACHATVCCILLQCVVAVCCSMLQCAAEVAVCCSVLQCVAVCCSMLQYVAVCCMLQRAAGVAVCCSVLQRVAVCCSVLQWLRVCRKDWRREIDQMSTSSVLMCCSVLQRVPVYFIILQSVMGCCSAKSQTGQVTSLKTKYMMRKFRSPCEQKISADTLTFRYSLC